MRVVEVPLEEDLAPFSRFLWQHRVPHRIFEERGRQVLEVAEQPLAEQVHRAYDAWRRGELELAEVAIPAPAPAAGAGTAALRRLVRSCPGVTGLLLAAVAVFPFSLRLAEGEIAGIAAALTIVDLTRTASASLPEVLADFEVWRWLGPVLLHFSAVHLLFNCAVCFEMGRRVEAGRGTLGFLLVVAAIGIVSNLGQILLNPYPLFGGLSGVAYGLLGYVLVTRRRFPGEAVWQTSPALAMGLLIFLVIFSTGITEPFGLNVANAAHWFGLAAGGLLALASRRGSP